MGNEISALGITKHPAGLPLPPSCLPALSKPANGNASFQHTTLTPSPPITTTVTSKPTIIPPDTHDVRAFKLFEKMNKIFTRKSTIKFLEHRISRIRDGSVERIQPGRYQVYIHSNSPSHPSTCFDQILKRDGMFIEEEHPKDVLLQYAKKQVKTLDSSLMLSNFSLIISHRSVGEEPPHITTLYPSTQFALILSDNCPSSVVYEVPEPIKRPQDVHSVWDKWNTPHRQMPNNLIHALQTSNDAKLLIQEYGNVLVPKSMLRQVSTNEETPGGSIVAIPPASLHAEPESSDYRGVLYFTASPINTPNDEEESIETKAMRYTGVLLCGQLVALLWRSPGVGTVEREYLLYMLTKYIQQDASFASKKLSSLFTRTNESGISEFVKELEEKKGIVEEHGKLEAFIQETAADEAFCHYNVSGDFKRVSVDDLIAMWENEKGLVEKEEEVVVYFRAADSKILLMYPEEKDSWEGSNDDDRYLLIMDEVGALFHGGNGRLLDSDGDEIKCYSRSMTAKRRRRAY
jgi:hypothetical protein